MHKMFALIRAHWLSQISYRLRTMLGIFSILVSVIPLYFVSDALQPLMAESIRDEGGQYFGFLVFGMVAMLLINAAVLLLPASVSDGITRGTLEAMLSTPTVVPLLLVGMIGSGIFWTFLRIVVLICGGWVLGAPVQIASILPTVVILALTLLVYLPIGIIAAALVIAFRTAGQVPQTVAYVSILLGGVYYPTHVIPSWLQDVANLVPLTYALRALRRVILEGAGISTVAADLGMVIFFGVGLFTLSGLIFWSAFRYAKKTGTLTQY